MEARGRKGSLETPVAVAREVVEGALGQEPGGYVFTPQGPDEAYGPPARKLCFKVMLFLKHLYISINSCQSREFRTDRAVFDIS